MAEVVRTAIAPAVCLRTHRSPDEWLFVRCPRAWRALARAGILVPPRSRLRRAVLRRQAVGGWSAWVRGDVDLMMVYRAPDCLYEPPPELVSVGMRSSYRGRTGIRAWTADLREAWEQMKITPLEVLDAGDRLVILGHLHTRGRGSGVELDSQFGDAFWLERGLVARERAFFDWHAALRAAGIPTDALADLGLAPAGGSPAL